MNENTLQCEKITDSTKNICDDKNMSSRCDSQQFCIGSYGDSCLSCSMIQLSKSCNCDTKLKENCLFCDGQQCMMCLKGYYVHNGECLINKCDSKNPCFDNFYCDPATNSCTQCSSIGTYDCNCGSAQNCQTCAAQGDTCQTCIRGYNLINGSCYPKLPCLHTADCPLNQYCGSDNKCDICFGQPTSCNCGSAINCYYCGASGGCASCLPGYGTDQIFSCSIPICSIEIPPGSYCSGPDAASKCPSATTACNCGFAQNCSQCTADLSHCEDCLDDSIMIDNECVIAPPGYTGVCNDPSDSSKCLSGFACILVPTCHSCQNVSAGYLCNCHGKQYASCIQCDRDKCGVCFTHFVLIDGKCETECQASSECKIGQQCGRQRACQDCNGQMECNCDGMLNCKECNDTSCTVCQYGWKQTDKSSCAKCASGFVMSDGICNRVEKPENKVLTAINIIGMVFALIIIICGILGIIIYYVRRPKRHTFQHSMAR
uniref:Cysteine-rich membrane protein 1 n=2 Tax=Spironucleus salmonicida TaxID=348837 RepID=V6M6P6_9EUKA|eukprot:EST49094.1 Cysteine-rich membrane protein 1 [Spironucleus salmonicida]